MLPPEEDLILFFTAEKLFLMCAPLEAFASNSFWHLTDKLDPLEAFVSQNSAVSFEAFNRLPLEEFPINVWAVPFRVNSLPLELLLLICLASTVSSISLPLEVLKSRLGTFSVLVLITSLPLEAFIVSIVIKLTRTFLEATWWVLVIRQTKVDCLV